MHARELTIDELIAMKDEEIDLSDIPEADEYFWKDAKVLTPKSKKQIPFYVDQEVLEWFSKFGHSYQARMNSVLKAYVNAQKTVASLARSP